MRLLSAINNLILLHIVSKKRNGNLHCLTLGSRFNTSLCLRIKLTDTLHVAPYSII